MWKEANLVPTWLQISNDVEPVLSHKTDALDLLTEHYDKVQIEIRAHKDKTERQIANKISAEPDPVEREQQT